MPSAETVELEVMAQAHPVAISMSGQSFSAHVNGIVRAVFMPHKCQTKARGGGCHDHAHGGSGGVAACFVASAVMCVGVLQCYMAASVSAGAEFNLLLCCSSTLKYSIHAGGGVSDSGSV